MRVYYYLYLKSAMSVCLILHYNKLHTDELPHKSFSEKGDITEEKANRKNRYEKESIEKTTTLFQCFSSSQMSVKFTLREKRMPKYFWLCVEAVI